MTETTESSPQDEPNQIKFEDLGLRQQIVDRLTKIGFEKPTEIQAKTIPVVLEGTDIIGLAQTGSGKTGAYALSTLSKLKYTKFVEILVLTPTRELARQVATEFERFSANMNIDVVQVVGGTSTMRQIELINRRAKVIVATPGRLIDLLSSGRLKRFQPETIILDEADEMLDMGFIESIEEITKYLPAERQTLLFSATMNHGVKKLAGKLLNNPVEIKSSNALKSNQDIEQRLYILQDRDRLNGLLRLIDSESPEKSLIFCRTKKAVDTVCEELNRRKLRVKSIHGDMSQDARFAAMTSLKKGDVKMLVATDVASRGLDIADLSHVYNFQVPDNKDRYTHRIGRTGRAGRSGVAITLATIEEMRKHEFFRNCKMDDFDFRALPTKDELVKVHNKRLINELEDVQVDEHSVEACTTLFAADNNFEVFCRMFAHLKSGSNLDGPNSIGYSRDDVKRLIERRGNRRQSGGSSRPYSRDSGRSRDHGRPRERSRSNSPRGDSNSSYRDRPRSEPRSNPRGDNRSGTDPRGDNRNGTDSRSDDFRGNRRPSYSKSYATSKRSSQRS